MLKKFKSAVIIGFGSIGKRHYKILIKNNYFEKVFVLSKRKLNIKNCIHKINDLKNIDPDYFILCSETNQHYKQLNYINKNFKKKKILVEKPIFEKFRKLVLKNKNKVYVAYNFRFHPIIKKIKQICYKQNIFYTKVLCGSFLPSWRSDRDYTKIYSSNTRRGGGVLLDLSHELDYLKWIFGNFKVDKKIYRKISFLKTSSKDFLSINANINNKHFFEISLNYFLKFPKREIIIEGKNLSIYANLLKNEIVFKKKKNIKKIKFPKNSLAKSYQLEHEDILFNNGENICGYFDAVNITKYF